MASSVIDARQSPPTYMINKLGVPQGSRLRPKKLVKDWKIRAGTWNVGTLTGRLRKIVDGEEEDRFLLWAGDWVERDWNWRDRKWMGCQEQEKELPRQEFEAVIRKVREEKKLIIGVDMIGRVGKRRDGYEKLHRGHVFGTRNELGNYKLEMAQSFKLACMNTWFQKLDEYLVTYESGGVQGQIDYILVRGANKSTVTNCKVILGEACVKQHI
ncbi:uncharacterized protein LOC135223356 [Macrobrachium nipponense]|uniref:uncharacterized protein LOC135223356 n=1 Tax=Macrobrachium nipponense TaxID=159736 RepID=UPI0030C88861